MSATDDARRLAGAATPGPWAWRGYSDGSIELRTVGHGGIRVLSTLRSEACIVASGEDVWDYQLYLTLDACETCKKAFDEGALHDFKCEKPENLNTIWVTNPGHTHIRPINDFAVNEQTYRTDVARVEHPDAAFIAWCRTGVPVLVDDNEALRVQLAKVQQELADECEARSAERSVAEENESDLRARLAAVEAELVSEGTAAANWTIRAEDERLRAEVAEGLLASIRDWTISASHQAEGERINVEYGDGCETAFPVNTPKTIGEIIADHDRTWPHSSVGAAVLGTDQEQAPTEPDSI